MTSVDYLPKVTSIGNYAFYGCKALTTVDLAVAGTIGGSAFRDCKGLTTVKFGYQEAMTWGSSVFLGVTTSNVALSLGTYEHNNNVTGGTTWRTYTWKSISPYLTL